MNFSHFKFLDSYTKEDKDIFFGRDREIEDIYTRVFKSKILLIYGASGTGKTSLIQCGLSSHFNDSDWHPLWIRRGNNIIDSFTAQITASLLTPARKGQSLKELIQSHYLDFFKPIYLIFDQFEELFIFGTRDEIQNFVKDVSAINKSDLPCKLLFVIRGEYLEHLTAFEDEIPEFIENRIRIEKMTRSNAMKVISGTCSSAGINMEENFPSLFLNKLGGEKTEIELTWLQVFVDKLYRKCLEINPGKPYFSKKLLEEVGQIGDILSGFLDEQISKIKDTETALIILKSFVSAEGTKKQITHYEINEFCRMLGKDLPAETIDNFLQQFITLRILRDKDAAGKYELRHDSLASRIYEKITLAEKEIMEVRQMIANRYKEYETRQTLLGEDELNYIAPYQNKVFLTPVLSDYVNQSKKVINSNKRLKMRVNLVTLLGLLLLISSVAYWYYKKERVSRSNELAAMGLTQVEKDPTLAYLLGEEAWKINPGKLAHKTMLNAYFNGPFYYEIPGDKFVVSPNEKFMVISNSKDSTLKIWDFEESSVTAEKKISQMVSKITFHPDGEKFILIPYKLNEIENNPILYNSELKKLMTIKIAKASVHKLIFSKSGDTIYTSSSDSVISLWNSKGNLIDKFKTEINPTGFYISPFGNLIVYFTEWVHAKKSDWFIMNLFDKKKFSFKENSVSSLEFSNDGNHLLIRDYIAGGNLWIYNRYGKIEKTIFSTINYESSIEKYLLTSDTAFIKSWDNNFKILNKIPINTNSIPWDIKFSSDNKLIAYSDAEQTKICDVQGIIKNTVIGRCFFPPTKKDYILSHNKKTKTLSLFDFDARELFKINGINDNVYIFNDEYSVFLTKNENNLVQISNDGKIYIYNVGLKDKLIDFDNAYFSEDKKSITYVSEKEKELLFTKMDAIKMKKIKQTSITFEPEDFRDDYKISKNSDYYGVSESIESENAPDSINVKIYNSDNQIIFTSSLDSALARPKLFNSLDFSGQDRFMITSFTGDSAIIHDLKRINSSGTSFHSYKTNVILKGHKGIIFCVSFSPDGKYIATASADSTVRIWKFDSEKFTVKFVTELKGHRASVMSARFAPNGKYILTSSSDSSFIIWNLKGEKVVTSNLHPKYYYQDSLNRKPLCDAIFSFDSLSNNIIIENYVKFIITEVSGQKKVFYPKSLNCWQWGDFGKPFFEDDNILPFDNNYVHTLEISTNIFSDGEQMIAFSKGGNSKIVNTNKYEYLDMTNSIIDKFTPDGKYLIIRDGVQLKFLPVVPEEIIRKVREEKVFGRIRDFSKKEKKEFGIEE